MLKDPLFVIFRHFIYFCKCRFYENKDILLSFVSVSLVVAEKIDI